MHIVTDFSLSLLMWISDWVGIYNSAITDSVNILVCVSAHPKPHVSQLHTIKQIRTKPRIVEIFEAVMNQAPGRKVVGDHHSW